MFGLKFVIISLLLEIDTVRGTQEKFCEPYKRTVNKILSQRNKGMCYFWK